MDSSKSKTPVRGVLRPSRTPVLSAHHSTSGARACSGSENPNLSFNGPSSSTLRGANTPSKGLADRFVPRRGSAEEQDVSRFHLVGAGSENATANGDGQHAPTTPSKEELKDCLDEHILDGKLNAKVLTFQQRAPRLEGSGQDRQRALYRFQNAGARRPAGNSSKARARVTRQIPRSAERILDAPNFLGDYYLNLLDWGPSNVVALALDTTVYLWDAKTAEITELLDTEDDANKIASLKWAATGNFLAIGLYDGTIEVWDAAAKGRLRCLRHSANSRVGTLAWNKYFLTSGCKDGSLKVWDVRLPADRVLVCETNEHDQEICGMQWRADGKRLATGGNDNIVNVYDFDESDPKLRKRHTLVGHQAAVKAIGWCPWERDTLATGGGTEDRRICFWNTTTGELIDSIDTGSQVSSVVWSKNPACRELVSAHGYSTNALVVWKYPSLAKVAELEGHTERVLHMVLSPDGTTVASASPEDESLRFWKIFDVEAPKSAKPSAGARAAGGTVVSGQRGLTASRSIR